MLNFFIYFKGTGSHDKCDFRRVVTLGLNKELQNGFNILCFVLGQKKISFLNLNIIFLAYLRDFALARMNTSILYVLSVGWVDFLIQTSSQVWYLKISHSSSKISLQFCRDFIFYIFLILFNSLIFSDLFLFLPVRNL